MRTELFIGGIYVDAGSGQRFADIEPATENELAQVAHGDAPTSIGRWPLRARPPIADRGRG